MTPGRWDLGKTLKRRIGRIGQRGEHVFAARFVPPCEHALIDEVMAFSSPHDSLGGMDMDLGLVSFVHGSGLQNLGIWANLGEVLDSACHRVE